MTRACRKIPPLKPQSHSRVGLIRRGYVVYTKYMICGWSAGRRVCRTVGREWNRTDIRLAVSTYTAIAIEVFSIVLSLLVDCFCSPNTMQYMALLILALWLRCRHDRRTNTENENKNKRKVRRCVVFYMPLFKCFWA